MSSESEERLRMQQEVYDFWAQQEGAIVDKTPDGGIVLMVDGNRHELKPHMVSQAWLMLQSPKYIIQTLHLFLHDLETHYDSGTPEQRIRAIEYLELHLSMVRKQLEQEQAHQ